MDTIEFKILQPTDQEYFHLIADWYLSEWKIPIDKTLERLKSITKDKSQFQVLMMLNQTPIAAAGLYNHVGLIDKEPRFGIYKNWLALVFTIQNQRRKGYGALICNFIQEHSKSLGIDSMYLFTDTAEELYKRLGWKELERVSLGERKVVVMKLDMSQNSTF